MLATSMIRKSLLLVLALVMFTPELTLGPTRFMLVTPELTLGPTYVSAAYARVAAQSSAIDVAFAKFWDAKNPQEAAAAAAAIVNSGVTFDAALGRLKKGRTYPDTPPHGVVRLANKISGTEFLYTLDVPASYDPSKKYQVRVQLHGGVGRPQATIRGNGSIGTLAGPDTVDQIYVLPIAWADAMWWQDVQISNLRMILDSLKRTYNVDENRVVMSGVSDGGTGAYYFAMRDTTPYASFLPLNGFVMILANPANGIDVELYPQNLLNKPFFVVNGGKDPLYPTSAVEPYVKHLQKGGVEIDYHPQPNGVHNTAWWPEVRDPFEAFARNHPRDPYPAKLTWEVSALGPDRRSHWLLIDKLSSAKAPKDRELLADLNDMSSGNQTNFGVRVNGLHITWVVPGTNADTMGLQAGDTVISINGRTLPQGLDLLEFLGIYRQGDKLTFHLSRDNKPVDLSGIYNPQTMTRVVPLFFHSDPVSRVDLVRDKNTIRATTRGIAEFTLLASPDVFDLAQPITVIADGKTVFNRRVDKSLETLMKWAALDNDRTMLFGAELHIKLD